MEISLELAGVNESITVNEDAAQFETYDTKLGQVIDSKQVTGLPLNGRSYTDLLAIQGGVATFTQVGMGMVRMRLCFRCVYLTPGGSSATRRKTMVVGMARSPSDECVIRIWSTSPFPLQRDGDDTSGWITSRLPSTRRRTFRVGGH